MVQQIFASPQVKRSVVISNIRVASRADERLKTYNLNFGTQLLRQTEILKKLILSLSLKFPVNAALTKIRALIPC